MKPLRFVLLASVLTVLAACDDDDDDNSTPPEEPPTVTADIRVLHASPDAPNVNVLVDDSVAIADLPFESGTGFVALDEGTYTVQVDGIAPDGSSIAAVIGPVDLTLEGDTEVTVIATGYVAPDDGEPAIGDSTIVVIQPASSAVADSATVTAVHAAPNAPAVDVYVTAPGDSLEAQTAAVQFEFGDSTEPLTLVPGDYRLRVTPEGDPGTVVFDSGETGVTIADGASLLIAAIENTGPGESPIKLAVLDGAGSSVLLDAATPATLKAAHSAPGVGPVDVFATRDGGDAIEIISDLPYAGTGTLCSVGAGTYTVDVSPDGAGVEGSAINVPGVVLAPGKVYSAIATVVDDTATLLLTEDQDRPVATQALVKAVHGAPAAGTVDVYVTAAGEVSSEEITSGDVTPTLDDFPVGAISDYLVVAPGSYDLRVVAIADPGSVAINVENLEVTAGQAITAIARGPETLSPDPADFSVIVLDNSSCQAE